MRKKIYSGVGLVLMLVLGYLIYEYYPRLGIITGYSAKRVCSCKFIADRTLEQIESEDLATNPLLGDHSIIRDAADQMFDPNGMIADLKTLGLLVLHKDTLIYERYADGYDAGTELLGWSMTKSIMNSWVNSESNGHIAMMQPLEYTPGDVWEYSSGTSNIISLYLRNQYRDHDDYLRYIHERLFIPLGMESTVLETDESGTYIGSSYTYATTRDWARFGTLYLRDGTWNGDRLLPKDWIAYTREVAPASGGVYGAQFWTNADGAELPDAPHDMYSCNGFEGQRVFIIPSHDLVIVRMGLNSHVDFNSLIRDIVGAVPIVK